MSSFDSRTDGSAMGAYLDRLNAQYDEIRDGIDTLIDRAADENRDVSDAEQTQVDRDRERMTELQTAIERYTALETDGERVTQLRRTVATAPRQTRTQREEDTYDVAREFPTPGDYAITVHRASVLRDPAAREKLDRATAHQLTTDNPGLIPRPIVGPLIDVMESSRPFIQSIQNRPLPTGKFDRPIIAQHVKVGKQAAEKTLTESQKMVVSTIPVAADTFAGHLNISRQDIKWTSPAILNIVFGDFANMYALATCDSASDGFVASITGAAVPIATRDAKGLNAALYTAASNALLASNALPDTLWAAPDMWAAIGGFTNTDGAASYPSLSLTSTSGNPLGLRLVVDAHFAAGTLIVGPSQYAEWYEDVDGLLQVGEPDVLGQLVGYAGYGAFVNVQPQAYTKLTMPPPV